MNNATTSHVETVIVGGGQAGLAVSYCLAQQGRSHVVLEQAAQPGNAWRNGRWDSFTVVTPNWATRLPGAEYHGDAPDGFMPRDKIVAYFERYVERFHLPIHYGERATSIVRIGNGYRVETDATAYAAANVVVATGLYQQPKIPAFAVDLPPAVRQLHSSAYRNPAALPPGAVLIVGSADSGCQIAEDLYQAGRTVYLATGRAPRWPRRYRGKDIVWWASQLFGNQTVDDLPSPKLKFSPHPHVTGRDGGHTLNLHQFARDGVVLLGHLRDVSDGTIVLAPDLKDNLAAADQEEVEIMRAIDGYVARGGLDAPEERLPALRDGYAAEELLELDLATAGITSVIWATGYTFDFRHLVKLPIFDDDGYPIQRRGVTDYPGLYFVGLPWLHTAASGLLAGVGDDAAYIASHLHDRQSR